MLLVKRLRIALIAVQDMVTDWIFRHVCKGQYEHMQHLVDDIIRLEKEKSPPCEDTVTSGSNDETHFLKL